MQLKMGLNTARAGGSKRFLRIASYVGAGIGTLCLAIIMAWLISLRSMMSF